MASILHIFLTIFLFTEALSWTIDLPEIRKFIFDTNEKFKEKHVKEHETLIRNDVYYYDNKDGSLQHAHSESKDEKNTQYAEVYGHQSYMEKKVQSVVRKGSLYLEELRKSIERYNEFLQNCSRSNFSMPVQASTSSNSTWQPQLELPAVLNVSRSMSCAEVTNTSEHVRRLADLAMITARELQDIGYAKKYQKYDFQRENELILKLAWFLDRLAYYTGYDPDIKSLIVPKTQADANPLRTPITTDSKIMRRYYSDDREVNPPPTPISLVNNSAEIRDMMMNCLKQSSNQTAVERCRYPFPIPPMLNQILNTNMSTTSETTDTTASVLPISTTSSAPNENNSDETQELLITADSNHHDHIFIPPVKQRNVRKRSTEDPITNFFKGFIKTKVWLSSNRGDLNLSNIKKDFQIENGLKSKKLHKRSLIVKKYSHLISPENPIQDLSNYVKSKPTTHFNKDNEQVIQLKEYLEKINNKKRFQKVMNKKHDILNVKQDVNQPVITIRGNMSLRNAIKIIRKRSLNEHRGKNPLLLGPYISLKPVTIINEGQKKIFEIKKLIEKIRNLKFMQKLHKLKRSKRSLAISYRDMTKPRISEDPFNDLGYYVKNKPTTNYNPSLSQAAQARLALEQHFATGNILVIRQYGANYNPLVPNAFYFGYLRGLADN